MLDAVDGDRRAAMGSYVERESYHLLCRIGLHLWQRWRVIDAHAVTRDGDASAIGRTVVQERECSACGLIRQTSNTIYFQ